MSTLNSTAATTLNRFRYAVRRLRLTKVCVTLRLRERQTVLRRILAWLSMRECLCEYAKESDIGAQHSRRTCESDSHTHTNTHTGTHFPSSATLVQTKLHTRNTKYTEVNPTQPHLNITIASTHRAPHTDQLHRWDQVSARAPPRRRVHVSDGGDCAKCVREFARWFSPSNWM